MGHELEDLTASLFEVNWYVLWVNHCHSKSFNLKRQHLFLSWNLSHQWIPGQKLSEHAVDSWLSGYLEIRRRFACNRIFSCKIHVIIQIFAILDPGVIFWSMSVENPLIYSDKNLRGSTVSWAKFAAETHIEFCCTQACPSKQFHVYLQVDIKEEHKQGSLLKLQIDSSAFFFYCHVRNHEWM